MIKICFITETYGGIARYTDHLSENLRQSIDYDVKILSINYDQDFSDLIQHEKSSNSLKYIPIKSHEQIRDVLGNKILKSTSDIIHIQHEFNIFRSNHYFLELLENINYYSEKIIIVTLHSVYTDRKRIQFYQKCSKLCDLIVVHQENAKIFLLNNGIYQDKIAVIPHGTPEITRFKYPCGFFMSQKIKIIFSGFITKTKSYCEALLSLISYEGFEIIVAGMVKDEEVRKRLFALKNQSKADLHIIPRFLEEEELVSMIYEANYLILPYNQSYYSTSGMLHLGISLNTITLVSSSPKFSELVERVPECEVPDGNYKEAINNIENLKMQESILDKLAEFAEETSWDKIAKMTSYTFDFLIKRSNNGLIRKILE
ncbi:MAG: glycosyltransferase [Candidatus Kariarchaeaceae archaeon]|jgi:hypothetical protein